MRHFQVFPRPPVMAALLASSIQLAACGSENAQSLPPRGSTVSDSAGVQVIVHREGDGGDPLLHLVETERIGVAGGNPMQEFDRVVAVAVDDDGTYFVANGGSGTVRVFSSSGDFLREFGGLGDGPSEVRTLAGVKVVGDSVFVRGIQNKMVLFRRDGEFLETVLIAVPPLRTVEVLGHVSGRWLVQVGRYIQPGLPPGQNPFGVPQIEVYLVDDLSEALPEEPVLTYDVVPLQIARSGNLYPPMFVGRASLGASAAGDLFLTRPPAYRIDGYDIEGSLFRTVIREVQPVSVGAGDVGAVQAHLEAYHDSAGTDAWSRDASLEVIRQRASLPLPDHLPAIGALLVGPDGSFWTRRTDESSPVEFELAMSWQWWSATDFVTEPQWDVYDARGLLVGTARLPGAFTPMAVTESHVTGVLVGDYDVEHVVTYEVRRP